MKEQGKSWIRGWRWAGVSLALITLLMAPPSVARASNGALAPATARCTVTATAGLKVRATPSFAAAQVGLLSLNAQVTATARSADGIWVAVSNADVTGFAAATFLKCTPDVKTLPVMTQAPPAPTPVGFVPIFKTFPPDGGSKQGLEASFLLLQPAAIVNGRPLYRDALGFQLRVRDADVGPKDGDGIKTVSFRITAVDQNGNDLSDANGNPLPPVLEQLEQNAGFCAFGGGDPTCNIWDFAKHSYKWPNGAPIANGFYKVTMEPAAANDQKALFWFLTFAIKLPTTSAAADLVATIVAPAPGASPATAAFYFRVQAYDRAVGTRDGAGIDSVDMRILDSSGHQVHQRTEKTAGYCSFGGGEPDCTTWNFAGHNFQWPNGDAIGADVYTLQATIHAQDGRTLTIAGTVQIQPY